MRLFFGILLSVAVMFYFLMFLSVNCPIMSQQEPHAGNQRIFTYNHNSPLILITGFPGSGLSLVKQLFNQNLKFHCKPDISLLTTMITQQSKIISSKLEMNRLSEAKINFDIINSAYSSFILELFLPKVSWTKRLISLTNL